MASMSCKTRHKCANAIAFFSFHYILCTTQTDKPLKCGCSGELEMDEEIIAVAVKVVKGGTDPDMVQKEIDALAAVRGMPHFIQDVDPKYHQHGDELLQEVCTKHISLLVCHLWRHEP